MKLLCCPDCGDIFNIVLGRDKACGCGKTRGRYTDKLNATYDYGIPLGMNGPQLVNALRAQYQKGEGIDFTAFGIRSDCPTFKKQP